MGKRRIAIGTLCGVLTFCAAHNAKAAFGDAQEKGTSDSPAYQVPSVASISASLASIRQRLETDAPVRAKDKYTGEEITDLSHAGGDVEMDPGAQGKFAPLHYTMGVIDSGLLAAADATGDKHFDDLVVRQFQFYHDHLPQAAAAEKSGTGKRGPLWNLLHPYSLDSCGAIGTAMIQARIASVGPDMSDVINRWANYVHEQQFRLPDGTLARKRPFPESVWLDDAYMGPPILAAMGQLSHNTAFTNDAARQLRLFYDHLFVPQAGLFTHGTHLAGASYQPHYFWGRANGWYAMSLVTVLELLPANYPTRAELIQILQHISQGLASCQSGTGLWHQLLNRPDTYLETSCTAMFTFALAKGVNHGWLDAGTFAPVAIAGWNGLRTRIDSAGHVTGTCVGTSFAADAAYYYHRPQRDDAHGYGPILLAGAEMIHLLQNPHVHITGDDPIMINAVRRENP